MSVVSLLVRSSMSTQVSRISTLSIRMMIRFLPIISAQFSDINLDEYSAIPQGTGLD